MRKIIITADGSKTIQITEWNEQYHSIHGAIQEAKHVFLKHGLAYLCNDFIGKGAQVAEHNTSISILEIGFGTGLNAFLTLLEANRLNLHINYVGVEAYPVSIEEINQLNYAELLLADKALFSKLHTVSWGKRQEISRFFSLTKHQKFVEDITEANVYNLIYFDAFGARLQPELWTEQIFKKMYTALKTNGVLVTYSAKGSVRRAMQAVGFTVEKLAGPPGKREMLRAIKTG